MKWKILHESKGRMRLHLNKPRMSLAEADQLQDYLAALPGVRHVRVAGGVRFDLALQDAEALWAYTAEFTGGQLKVAPEHCAPNTLAYMGKAVNRIPLVAAASSR